MVPDPIEIRQATDRHQRRQFLLVAWKVLRHDPMWVPPLLPEMERRIDPATGAWFRRGDAEFFVAYRHGHAVGSISCALDPLRNCHLKRSVCVFGFNHMIPDYAVARALWDHAASWARDHGLSQLYGPIHLDYEDGYGALVEGFDRPPVVLCGHTPAYYREFLVRYGFRPGHEQNIALEANVAETSDPSGPAAKLHRAAQLVRRRGRVTVRGADMDAWDAEIDAIVPLLRAALGTLAGSVPWQRESLAELARGLRDILDPDLVLFAEKDGQVIGCVVAVPNWNEALIHANGLRYPWDRLRAWYHLKRRRRCLAMKSILVHPDHWGVGADALMLHEMVLRARDRGYEWLDMSMTGTENPMTVKLASRLGARIYKRWQLYAKDVEASPGL